VYVDLAPTELAALAAERNCELVVPDDYTLLVDLDDGAQLNQRVLTVIRERCGVLKTESWPSRSGTGTHYRIHLVVALSQGDRLLLQAVLGSDPMKECLSVFRAWAGHETPSVLFKPR
jgi:hypothetical protein